MEKEHLQFSDCAQFYHVCTDGSSIDWLFKDDEDFISGINRLGICIALVKGVSLFSFVLMDNHVHFLLRGSLPMCKDFIIKYKTLTGRWNSFKYGDEGKITDVPSHIIKIESEEQLLSVIAYIDRNPIKASFPFLPFEYRWGSAQLMFRKKSHNNGKKLVELSLTQRRKMFCTRVNLPLEWRVDENDMLNPECFVEWKKVESLFKSAYRYLYFLIKKVEKDFENEYITGSKIYISDKNLRPILLQLAQDLYGTKDIKMLNINSRLVLARKLRYEYYSTPKQLSRMLGVTSDILKDFL